MMIIDVENHWSTGPQPIVINGVTWGPYKWPQINGFHWGEITLLIGAKTRFISGWGPSCIDVFIQVELRHGKSLFELGKNPSVLCVRVPKLEATKPKQIPYKGTFLHFPDCNWWYLIELEL